MKKQNILMMVTTLLCSMQLALGTLTATVSPGYQFSPGEQPTLTSLNALGQPSITISGTVSGSTGLTPGSVNGALLANSVVDGITLQYNAGSPRQIYVLMSGLVNTNSGLFAAANNSLQLFIDTNFFVLATNSVANTNSSLTNGTNWLTLASASNGVSGIVDGVISSNAAINLSKIYCPSNLLVWGNSNNALAQLMYDTRVFAIQQFTNVFGPYTNNIMGTNYVITFTNIGPALSEVSYAASVYQLPGSGIFVTNHIGQVTYLPPTNGAYITVVNPYNAVPSTVRWVMVCLTNNFGYVVNDELDVHSFVSGYFSEGASITNVWLTAGTGTQQFLNKTNGTTQTFNAVQWSAKAYLKP